jgi:hypothetical protein
MSWLSEKCKSSLQREKRKRKTKKQKKLPNKKTDPKSPKTMVQMLIFLWFIELALNLSKFNVGFYLNTNNNGSKIGIKN